MTWSDEDLEQMFTNLTGQLVEIGRQLLAQKAVVSALKTYVASRLQPDNPQEFLDILRRSEERLLGSDPRFREGEELAQAIALLQKHGKTPGGEA